MGFVSLVVRQSAFVKAILFLHNPLSNNCHEGLHMNLGHSMSCKVTFTNAYLRWLKYTY